MNMQALMKQAQNLQRDMLKVREELDKMEFDAENGMVKVKVNGKKEVLSINISNEFEKEDIELLEDMILIVLNKAFKEVDKATESKMSKFGNIPGLF